MISCISILLNIYIIFTWARILQFKSFCSVVFASVLILSISIFWASLFASYYHHLGSLEYWNIFFTVLTILTTVISVVNKNLREIVWKSKINYSVLEDKLKSIFTHKVITGILIIVVIVALINLFIIMWFEPGTPDVLEYHLARVAYYLQQESFDFYNAHYWAQVIYPIVSTSLFTFITLISEKNAGIAALAQWIASWIAMISVYGIARQLGANRNKSLISAIIFSLLTIVIAESATAQNDLVMAAFTGVAVYFFLSYKVSNKTVDLTFGLISLSLLIGIKFNWVQVILPFIILIIYICKLNTRKYLQTAGITVLLILTIVMPSGYFQNYQRYTDVFGPVSIRNKYTMENATCTELFKIGMLNIVRYVVDGVSLDGYIPNKVVETAQYLLRHPMKYFLSSCHINPSSSYGVKPPYNFNYYRQTLTTENSSGYGIAGFLLLIPAVIIAFFMPGLPRIFAVSFLLFFIIQSFASPYDYFHFRFFIMGAIFATPLVAIINWNKWYFKFALLFIIIGGLNAAICRHGVSLVPLYLNSKLYPPYLPISRSEQLTREIPDRQMMFELIEVIFPANSRLALDIRPIIAEYQFFGEGFKRKCYPIRDFNGKRIKIPEKVDFIIYSEDSPYYKKGDPVIIGGNERYGTIFYREVDK